MSMKTPSFRDGPQDQTSDAQLRIGESRDSGFDAAHRPGMTPKQARLPHGHRLRKEAVRRPAIPADPPATGPVPDPDGRGARHFALLYQPDRAQSAPGDGADPAAAGGNLLPRFARPRHRR